MCQGSPQGPSSGSRAWHPSLLVLNQNHLYGAGCVSVGGSPLSQVFLEAALCYWTKQQHLAGWDGHQSDQSDQSDETPLGFGGVLKPVRHIPVVSELNTVTVMQQ